MDKIIVEKIANGYVISANYRDPWKEIKTYHPDLSKAFQHLDGIYGEIDRTVNNIKKKED